MEGEGIRSRNCVDFYGACQSVTCIYPCLLQTNSLLSTSRQKPIAFDRKGSPVGRRLAVYNLG